jgi:DNA-binding NarL/FixJ family response regulator
MMLAGLRNLFKPTLDIVATAADGQALLTAAARLQPDLVIADISMPEIDGIEATRRLGATSPKTRVLILSFYEQASWVRKAFEAGAWGYLTKTAAAEELEGAVWEVLAGRFFISPSVARWLVAPPPAGESPVAEPSAAAAGGGIEGLTSREAEVAQLVGLGLSNKRIASRLGISVTTVRTHLSSVYGKLGQDSRVELALHAARWLSGRRRSG